MPVSTPLLHELAVAARPRRADLEVAFAALAERLRSDADYLDALREEIATVFLQGPEAHLLTETGVLADEPLIAGAFRRVGNRLAPPMRQTKEIAASARVLRRRRRALGELDAQLVADVVAQILARPEPVIPRVELASAAVILATRIAGAGVHPRLVERLPELEAWSSPFVELPRAVDHFAEAHVDGRLGTVETAAVRVAVEKCRERVRRFRSQKETLGTTLAHSSASLRMLQQLDRLDLLIDLAERPGAPETALGVAEALLHAVEHADGVRHFVAEKLDLVAYLVVGHAAQSGEKYAAYERSEVAEFAARSTLGGLIVAVFAIAKLGLSVDGLATAPQALVYGLNYAVCFVLIFALGGTLATKQPAYTASRLAEALRPEGEYESFPHLVRAICRSQFVSFVGNVVGAAALAAALLLVAGDVAATLVDADKARSLAESMHPLRSPSIYYAAVAGVMLSVAGFVAGFVKNAVVFHRVKGRIHSGTGVFRWLPRGLRVRIATGIEKNAGALFGNALLGFMLGAAGGIGHVLGLPFDIRHIAFASSHAAVSFVVLPELQTVVGFALLGVSVATIGLVNFLVSFGLTLSVAAHARRLENPRWVREFAAVWRLFVRSPLAFFVPTRGSVDRREA